MPDSAADPLAAYLELPRHERSYADLHDHLAALARAGLLRIVEAPVCKDTQMHPLVRWQYRGGIPPQDRRAFLFTHPTDARGGSYDLPVLVAGLAGNSAIYEIGVGRPAAEIGTAWVAAAAAPIAPRIITDAPCQDIIVQGDALDVPGAGLDGLPVPISSPGWDNAPYLSAGHFVTRDPETGVQNMGTYRAQVKSPRRLGVNASLNFRPGIAYHWDKYKAAGRKMPACVVLGCPPIIAYAAASKFSEDLDELAICGGMAGGPINVVRAVTVDLFVPAEAEIIIEGFIDTEFLEPEGPFGESHGYVNGQEFNPFMEVTAITRRRHPILPSIISQVTPSESSVIRRATMEPALLHFLRSTIGIRGLARVFMHEPLTAVLAFIVLQFEPRVPQTEVWRALYATASWHRSAGRWIVALDTDIDPENCDALLWAMAYRSQPQHDLKILDRKDPGHAPDGPVDNGETASVLVNATLRGQYMPVALPQRQYMEDARRLWDALGLPALRPEPPWHGYSLGHWPEALAREAEIAVRGEHFANSAGWAARRRGDVPMNTPAEPG